VYMYRYLSKQYIHVYVYIYRHVCMYVYIYILKHIYIHTRIIFTRYKAGFRDPVTIA
jgi:hypothetical protein